MVCQNDQVQLRCNWSPVFAKKSSDMFFVEWAVLASIKIKSPNIWIAKHNRLEVWFSSETFSSEYVGVYYCLVNKKMQILGTTGECDWFDRRLICLLYNIAWSNIGCSPIFVWQVNKMSVVKLFNIKVSEDATCYIPSVDGMLTVTGNLMIELEESELPDVHACLSTLQI